MLFTSISKMVICVKSLNKFTWISVNLLLLRLKVFRLVRPWKAFSSTTEISLLLSSRSVQLVRWEKTPLLMFLMELCLRKTWVALLGMSWGTSVYPFFLPSYSYPVTVRISSRTFSTGNIPEIKQGRLSASRPNCHLNWARTFVGCGRLRWWRWHWRRWWQQ